MFLSAVHCVREHIPVVQSPDSVSMAIRHFLMSDTLSSNCPVPETCALSNQAEQTDDTTVVSRSQYLGPAAMELFAAQATNCINQDHRGGAARQELHETVSGATNSTLNLCVQPQDISPPAAAAQHSDNVMAVLGPQSVWQITETDTFGMEHMQHLCQAGSTNSVTALETLAALAHTSHAIGQDRAV